MLLVDADGKEFSPTHATVPWYERWANILSLPLTIALISTFSQWQISSSSVAKDYVSIATQILRDPTITDSSPQLRDWAIDLLEKYSAVKISKSLKDELRSGKANLPAIPVVPTLLNELQTLIRQSQAQYLASKLDITLPLPKSEALQILLQDLSKNDDPKTKEHAISLLNELNQTTTNSVKNK